MAEIKYQVLRTLPQLCWTPQSLSVRTWHSFSFHYMFLSDDSSDEPGTLGWNTCISSSSLSVRTQHANPVHCMFVSDDSSNQPGILGWSTCDSSSSSSIACLHMLKDDCRILSVARQRACCTAAQSEVHASILLDLHLFLQSPFFSPQDSGFGRND